MATEKPTLAGIHDLLFGASKALALKLALELDLFSHVAAGHRTPDQLARATDASAQGIRALADALCGLGLLHKEGDGYATTPTAAAFLVKGEPTYYGDSYLDALLPWAWALDGPAAQAIRTGRGVGKDITAPQSAALWTSWSAAHATFYDEIAAEARGMWEEVGQACPLQPGRRVLDIACGHAIASLVLLADGLADSATLVDQYPEVLAVAAATADRAGVRDRISLQTMSIFSLELNANAYDLAYIGGTLYLLSLEQITSVLTAVRQSLRGGGLLVANTMISDADAADSAGPLVQGLRRFLYNGRFVPSYAQYEEAFRAAGFAAVRQLGGHLIIGTQDA